MYDPLAVLEELEALAELAELAELLAEEELRETAEEESVSMEEELDDELALLDESLPDDSLEEVSALAQPAIATMATTAASNTTTALLRVQFEAFISTCLPLYDNVPPCYSISQLMGRMLPFRQ